MSVFHDNIEVGVPGNLTDPKSAFEADLAPGEQIVSQVECDVKEPPTRTGLAVLILTILTFGLYYIYLAYCSCCRPKKIGAQRYRAALTNRNRVLVWRTITTGEQGRNVMCCIRGNRQLVNNTDVRWFHLRDLAHGQMVYRKTHVCCMCCRKDMNNAYLRLYFGSLPSSGAVAAMNFGFMFPGTVSMAKKIEPSTVESGFSLTKFILRMSKGAVSAVKFAGKFASVTLNPDSAYAKLRCLELISTQRDDMFKDDLWGSWDAFVKFQKDLANALNMDDVITGQNTGKFREYDESSEDYGVVKDGSVHIAKDCIPVLPNEEIIDAIPWESKWKCTDYLFTILTAGIYYFCVIRAKYSTRGAQILTRKRLFDVYLDAKSADMSGRFSWQCQWWSLAGTDTGYIERDRKNVQLQVNTDHGALVIARQCMKLSYGDVMDFFLQFAKNDADKIIEANGRTPFYGEDEAASYVKDALDRGKISDEVAIKYLSSEGMYIGRNGCPVGVQRCMTCGTRPFEMWQEVIVTSHRIWASSTPDNNPMCCSSLCSSKYQVVLWSSIPALTGWKVSGHVIQNENFWTRCCSCCCKPIEASAVIGFAFLDDSYPIFVSRYNKKTDKGFVEDEDITETRSVLAEAMAALPMYGAEVKATPAPVAYAAAPVAYAAAPMMVAAPMVAAVPVYTVYQQ
eukprot:GILI01000882.1.p2 GENE.GILI01000882.1~~GILI01000882.1.p2  ORF type:complete len:679 (+),score=242.87 GILI01000882.1:109-2145(+)